LKKSVDLLTITMDHNASKSVLLAIHTWYNWCRLKQVSPTYCSINEICEFFADKLAEGKSYNTVTGYYSAISKVYEKVDNVLVG